MLPTPKLLFCSLAWGSINPTLINCSGWGKENPRNTKAFTTVNCVVTPQMPSARTRTASKQNDFSLIKTRNPIRISCKNDSNTTLLSFLWHGHPGSKANPESFRVDYKGTAMQPWTVGNERAGVAHVRELRFFRLMPRGVCKRKWN